MRIDGCMLVNKVLIDGGATISLMPEGVMERLRKIDWEKFEIQGHYCSHILVGSISRNTMFVVVPSTANFNLLLGRDWIHVVKVPSTLHLKMFIWNDLEECQIIQADPATFNTPHAKFYNANRILVDVGPFNIEQGTDNNRQINEKGEPLTMVLKPHVGFELSHQDVGQGHGTAEWELIWNSS